MADKIRGLRVNAAAKAGSDGNGARTIQNEILLELPSEERKSLLSKMEFTELRARRILTEVDQPIDFAYFLNSGVASIITVMSDGKSVEVGLTGREGFVGLPLLVGYSTSHTRAVIQIEGNGFRISTRDLKSALRTSPKLERSLQRYSQELSIQSIQIAACNRLHEVDRRLARWLLMSQDRVGDSTFPLTQEFIAHMLGTRRASVTVAARQLHKAGLITYKRGLVTIKKRTGLERAACECYQRINERLENWRQDAR